VEFRWHLLLSIAGSNAEGESALAGLDGHLIRRSPVDSAVQLYGAPNQSARGVEAKSNLEQFRPLGQDLVTYHGYAPSHPWLVMGLADPSIVSHPQYTVCSAEVSVRLHDSAPPGPNDCTIAVGIGRQDGTGRRTSRRGST
jgi:hypothetical protein